MSKIPLAQFYSDNKKLIHFAVNKALKRLIGAGFKDRIEREELESMLTESFIRAYDKHDDMKSKFSTYFVMAAHNRITNLLYDLSRSPSTVSTSTFTDETGAECFDELFGEPETGIEAFELSSEVEYIKGGLSPFARILLEYTLSPPEFIEREYKAQQAQSEYALSIGTRAYHKKHLGLNFVVNCLKNTTNNSSQERFVNDAVNEIKAAISNTVKG